MKKKLVAMLLGLVMTASAVVGCGGQAAKEEAVKEEVVQEEAVEETAEETADVSLAEGEVKTGVSIQASASGQNAAAGENGNVQTDINIVALTVDANGVITSCAIESIQGNATFDAEGKLTSDLESVPSKNELGESYGMKAASGIGKEWNEQVAAIAEFAVGKTIEEVKASAIDESGKVKDADLVSSATIYAGGFIAQMEEAVNNAVALGAKEGDVLKITSTNSLAKSKEAGEEDGLVQIDAYISVVTLNGDVITSCLIDSVQGKANFNAKGEITSGADGAVQSKNQLGEAYGMKAASGIGKEWNEQAQAFAEYVNGKTVAEVLGMEVAEGKAADADLASSVTISVGNFLELIEKAE